MSIIKNKKEKSNIKLTNYFILLLIFIISIGITVYICSWYRLYDDREKNTPVIRDTLFEITSKELEHYILENPDCVLYMCQSYTNNCRNFEKDFKKVINKYNLKNYIVYVNLSSNDIKEFTDSFNSKYSKKIELNYNYPALIVMEDGLINSVLQSDDKHNLSIDKTKQFIEINKIGEYE